MGLVSSYVNNEQAMTGILVSCTLLLDVEQIFIVGLLVSQESVYIGQNQTDVTGVLWNFCIVFRHRVVVVPCLAT
jgi:hypothetical protein